MAKSREVGRIQFTLTLPLKSGLQVYDMADKMGVGANKVLQELFNYAAPKAKVKRISKTMYGIVFDSAAAEEEEE